MGVEPDSYGYYEERSRGGGTEYVGAGGRGGGGGGDYSMNLAGPYGRDDDDDGERGRRPSRTPGDGPNPFDDDAQASLRGVSPRPMEGGTGRDSVDTRRSVFREAV